MGLLGGQGGDRTEDFVNLEVGLFEIEFARLDFLKIKDVVDDAEERSPGVVDLADVVALLGIEGLLRARCERPMMEFIGVRIS